MNNKKGKLILTRHHESEWNKAGIWTGTHDAKLTPYGVKMSKKMGSLIKETEIDRAFSSNLTRSFNTLKEMLKNSDKSELPIEKKFELRERDYGDYTGKNKWKMKEVLGEERFNCVRREWNCPVPNGETLKTVYERVVPFYLEKILPEILKEKNILIVAHTNSIRALIKYIEKIPDEVIKNLEIPFGTVFFYELDREGFSKKREIKKVE
jgi:2,3-bisphosphoglycerate-dependent phosphoglycerate mutase